MAPVTSLSISAAATQITRDGHSWSSQLGTAAGPISYAFRSSAGEENTDSFTRFSAAQIAATEEALALWADVANITFVRAGGTGYSNSATILLANYNEGKDDDGRSGYAYPVGPAATAASNAAGDIWIDQGDSSNSNVALDSFGFKTLLHEIGHAIGLQHPGDYNASDDEDITYDDHAQYIEDSRQYSVMSYFNASKTGADHEFAWTVYGSTPLLHDIAAAQRLYGPNMSTRTGDTTYGFNSNADRDVYSIVENWDQVVFAVWDAGGNDTFDFSGYLQDQTITLMAGEFSDVGALTRNVAIAQGATIENAKGGSGNDHIKGNAAANKLYGNQGSDEIFGGEGNDRLYGNDGSDELYGDAGADQLFGGSGNDELNGGDGNDTLDGSEGDDKLFGIAGNDTMTGGSGDDNLFGGDGNDTLDGGDGNDGLNGGDGFDNMSGGSGNDVLVGGADNDTLKGGGGDDRHNGGIGADYMVGAEGNDTYYVDNAGDVVSDSATVYGEPLPGALVGLPTKVNAGIDTVYADLASYTLGSFMEDLKALKANPFAGTGNALDNWIQGHNAGDTLKGLGGADTLVGLGGRDVMTGGSHADIFKYVSVTDSGITASTRDRITDFLAGHDRIDLSQIDARSGNTSSLFFAGNNAFSFIDDGAFGGVAGQLRWQQEDRAGVALDLTIISGDVNGDAIADFQIELAGLHTLVSSDFIL